MYMQRARGFKTLKTLSHTIGQTHCFERFSARAVGTVVSRSVVDITYIAVCLGETTIMSTRANHQITITGLFLAHWHKYYHA